MLRRISHEKVDRIYSFAHGAGCFAHLEETFAKTDRCGRVRGGHIHYFLKNVDHHVNQLDPSKGNNDAAEAVYQQIVLKKTSG